MINYYYIYIYQQKHPFAMINLSCLVKIGGRPLGHPRAKGGSSGSSPRKRVKNGL